MQGFCAYLDFAELEAKDNGMKTQWRAKEGEINTLRSS